MNSLLRIYRFINLLSFDIAAGAIAGAIYFATLLQVKVRPYGFISLGMTVWIIYTADHLLDARKVKGVASTRRHRFHQDNFNVLTTLIAIALVADMIMIFFIKRPVLYAGFFVSAAVGLYLVLHRKLTFLKELFVAALYCTGILLPSLTVTTLPLMEVHYMLFLVFFNTALANLLLFSWFDRYHDRADQHQSFVTILGEQKTIVVTTILFGANLCLCVYGVATSLDPIAFVIPLLMNTTLLSIFWAHQWFALKDRYRLLGDAVFLMPFLYLLL